MADPLSVQCPSCMAPPNEDCRTEYPDPHADRVDAARLNAVERGVCALCTRFMVKGVPLVGEEVTAWHPDAADAATCPPLPDPETDWDGYALAQQRGLAPGRPGLEHFVSAEVIRHANSIDFNEVALDAQIDALHGPGAAAALDAAFTNGFPAVCPECRAGKCGNCDGSAWDDVTDKAVSCACPNHSERATDG